MAPRTAKAKKAADVKVSEDAPKKGRGKAKNNEETEQEVPDIDEKAAPVTKAKRGKKAQEDEGKTNGLAEDTAPPAKRGRKKNESPVEDKASNGDKSPEEETNMIVDEEQNEDNEEKNGNIEETQPAVTGRGGRKKPTKKEEKPKETTGRGRKAKIEKEDSEEKEVTEEKPKETTGRGRKAKQENEDSEEKEVTEEKPKETTGRGRKAKQENEDSEGKEVTEEKPKETTGRGRKAKQENEDSEEKEVTEEKPKGKGRARKAQPKAEVEEDKTEEIEEEVKPEPVTKGRKKGPTKATKEKTPESDKETAEEKAQEKTEEPKRKEAKGRKAQGKKTQAKEEVEDKEDLNEEKKEDDEEEEVKESAAKKRKVNKKEEKGQGESKEEEAEEDVPEAKVTKGKRGQKKTVESPETAETEEEPQDTGEPTNKRKRKPVEEKAAAKDTKAKAPLKNKATTNYEELDFTNSSKSPQDKVWNFKIASWNVDGVRAWLNKGGLDYIKYEKPDILCLQELKCAQDKLPDEITNLPGYHAYWLASDKDGYAGVCIYTTQLAINVQYGLQNEELDSEGRIITAEYELFYLICTYVPNAGRKLVTLPKRLQWNEEFRKHVKELDKKKPVIICGDMNVAHNEIDLANPKTNKKNAGFTEEERAGMTELLGDGFVDTFRHFYPDKSDAYTFWTYMMNARSKNVGWRLDYFIVSERLLPSICDTVIRDQVYGSDHCPISLFLHLTSADKPKE